MKLFNSFFSLVLWQSYFSLMGLRFLKRYMLSKKWHILACHFSLLLLLPWESCLSAKLLASLCCDFLTVLMLLVKNSISILNNQIFVPVLVINGAHLDKDSKLGDSFLQVYSNFFYFCTGGFQTYLQGVLFNVDIFLAQGLFQICSSNILQNVPW